MHVWALLTFGTVGAGAWAQTIEPTYFDVSEALLEFGVDVSSIPALSGLVGWSSKSACSIACSSLQTVFGNKVIPQQTPEYDAFTNSYWSLQQADVDPHCIFKPTKSADVSVMVLLSRLTQCPFAVKSGGHAAFQGASNIPGGITVALEKMKDIKLSADKKVASIEPGNLWFDVYTTLAPDNLAVIGGRIAAIGVGGLTLGGGISFFSNKYGWACDNVASFEVVTASGVIITASPSSYPDLYWALRGGGNNFGIVTKFNLETIPVGPMWGGAHIYNESHFPALVSAFYNLGLNSEKDPDAAQILSVAYSQGIRLASAELEYAKPVANAPIFSEWLAIPSLQDNSGIKSLADITVATNDSSPNGLRDSYWTATFKLDQDLITFILDTFDEEILLAVDAVIVAALSFQVITVPQLRLMSRKGGNALGLSANNGPLLNINPNIMWTNAADDRRIMKAVSNTINRSREEAKRRGLYVDYTYMNYASQFQEVIPTYGAENQQRLKKIAAKYDPTGVFQRLQPGFFKLD